MPERRPLIAIPARFSEHATALRFEADVVARAMVDAVYAAGGEPLIIHPVAPRAKVDEAAVRQRLWFADGVLLPGGGDVAPRWYGAPDHPTQYGVDVEQDAFDLAVAWVALADGLPLLSVCRGTQLVNVALGGTLIQDMAETAGDRDWNGNHREHVHDLTVTDGSPLAQLVGSTTTISCSHHQCIATLGAGLATAALSEDGVIEAVTLPDHGGWYLGVQWHPEDTAATDPIQAGLFARLVEAARAHRDRPLRQAQGA